MTAYSIDVWYFTYALFDEDNESSISWDDIPSKMREKLNVGDVLKITNEDDESYPVAIYDLEPCKVYGVHIERC